MAADKMEKRLTVSLPDEHYEALERLQALRRSRGYVTLSGLVRESVAEYLERHEQDHRQPDLFVEGWPEGSVGKAFGARPRRWKGLKKDG